MSGMFCFDIETLGIESTSCVLSVALNYCIPAKLKLDNSLAYTQLYRDTCFVKFDVREQSAAKRTMDRSTLDWWTKQGEIQRRKSFTPNRELDFPVEEGVHVLREFFNEKNDPSAPVWVRGSLDQLLFESLLRTFDIPEIIPYNQYRDVRTAISLLYPEEKGGYVEVPDFDLYTVNKHDPVADVCYDVLMLLRGKQ